RSEIQSAGGPRVAARVRAGIAGGADHANPRRTRRREQNVEVAGQCDWNSRAAARDVRQSDVDFGWDDVEVLRAADGCADGADRADESGCRKRQGASDGAEERAGAVDRGRFSLGGSRGESG